MKHIISLVARFLVSFVVMLIAYIASPMIVGTGSIPVSQEETSESMFVYGIIAGWVWTRPVDTRPVLQHQGT